MYFVWFSARLVKIRIYEKERRQGIIKKNKQCTLNIRFDIHTTLLQLLEFTVLFLGFTFLTLRISKFRNALLLGYNIKTLQTYIQHVLSTICISVCKMQKKKSAKSIPAKLTVWIKTVAVYFSWNILFWNIHRIFINNKSTHCFRFLPFQS